MYEYTCRGVLTRFCDMVLCYYLLSCQPRVTVMSCFVYKVNSDLSIRVSSSGVYKLMCY